MTLVVSQLLNKGEAILELDDDLISDLCKMVCQPGGGDAGRQIPEMAVQLLVFYTKHLDRMQQPFDLVGTTLEKINAFKDQKKLERDWRKQNPEHKTEPMALDRQRATVAFDQAVTILRRVQGATGVPLSYVVRHKLAPDQEDDDPPCGVEESNYLTYDKEMVAQAPILRTLTIARPTGKKRRRRVHSIQSSSLIRRRSGRFSMCSGPRPGRGCM